MSLATLSRRFKSSGVKSYVPVKKPMLSKAQKANAISGLCIFATGQ